MAWLQKSSFFYNYGRGMLQTRFNGRLFSEKNNDRFIIQNFRSTVRAIALQILEIFR